MLILMIMMIMIWVISLMLMYLNLVISKKKINNREKSSPFECGFDPLCSSRLPFSMQFYLVTIIFLIFDVEIIIFLPMINSFLLNKNLFWLDSIFFFILILLIGLYIEWHDGVLNWMK